MVQMTVRYGQVVSYVKLGDVSRGRKGTERYVVESEWNCLFCLLGGGAAKFVGVS